MTGTANDLELPGMPRRQPSDKGQSREVSDTEGTSGDLSSSIHSLDLDNEEVCMLLHSQEGLSSPLEQSLEGEAHTAILGTDASPVNCDTEVNFLNDLSALHEELDQVESINCVSGQVEPFRSTSQSSLDDDIMGQGADDWMDSHLLGDDDEPPSFHMDAGVHARIGNRNDDRMLQRQRSQSESDATRMRDCLQGSSSSNLRRRRSRLRASTEDMGSRRSASIISPTLEEIARPLSVGNATTESQTAVNRTAASVELANQGGRPNANSRSTQTPMTRGGNPSENTTSNHAAPVIMPTTPMEAAASNASESDPERRARMRWIRINRRFQLVITFVALLFSLLLFAILICWVVLTSSYVLSFDKDCDVPLKPYFWLVTLQLVLDVFRSDIMRVIFRWDASSNQRIPPRVVAYNFAYLVYAVLVLRFGINAVFIGDRKQCRDTAPELFNASVAFISLSMAAWTTIICGYLLPFCVVAALLTYNGYNPSHHATVSTGAQPVFPAAYSNTGAPPSCIEMLPILPTDSLAPSDHPRECCICMEEFRRADVVVETPCKHVFHKQCFREWLLQARTCPVCRTDIPSRLNVSADDEAENSQQNGAQIPLGPTGRPVAGLLRLLNHSESTMSVTSQASPSSGPLRSRQQLAALDAQTQADVEEGFPSRVHAH